MWLALLLLSCEGSRETQLSGAVAKGPFVLGSEVTIAEVGPTGFPTGAVYPTQTTSDGGTFELEFDYVGPILIEANGYHYNEVTGALSGGTLLLRAFHEASGGSSTAYVNVLTHLSIERVRTLVAGGASIDEAIEEAETDVRAAVGVGPEDFTPGAGTALSLLTGDNDANAYLLALGSVFAQAAVDRVGAAGPVDATLQELMNTIALDIAADGVLTESLRDELLAAQAHVDGDAVMTALQARFDQIGSDATVPDIHRILDNDLDGTANGADNCLVEANDQADADEDGIGDYCECGNGIPNVGEECDDNDLEDADGCNSDCTLPACGNGIDDPGEVCLVEIASIEVSSGASWPWQALLADLDEDGKIDILSSGDPMEWAAGTGDGTFGPLVTSSDLPANPGRVSLADIDGDGDPDAAVVKPDSNQWFILENQSDGTFEETARVTGPYLTSIATGDIDGDLDLDVVVVLSGNESSLVAHHNDGSGTFTEGPAATGASNAAKVVLTDLDADGRADAILSNDAGGWIFLADGSGGFASPATFAAPAFASGIAEVEIGDADGDGKIDLLLTSSGEATSAPGAALRFGDGEGAFGDEVTVDVSATGIEWTRWGHLADLDGDGRDEPLLTALSWVPGEGPDLLYTTTFVRVPHATDRTFGAPQTVSHDDMLVIHAIADVDGDGDDEVLAARGRDINGGAYRVGLSVLDWRP